jgi:hypothetical protein
MVLEEEDEAGYEDEELAVDRAPTTARSELFFVSIAGR